MVVCKIKVTDEDIASGKPKLSGSCPVYNAARRAGLDVYAATPSRGLLMVKGNFVKLPIWASAFMTVYDFTGIMRPFEFEVKYDVD